jgi:hypothetical protein
LPMGIRDAWSVEPPNPRHDAHSTPPEPGRAPGGCHAVDLARVAPGFSAVTIFDPLASYVSKRTHLIFRLCRALIIHPPYVSKRRKSGLFYSEQSASSLLRCVYTFFYKRRKEILHTSSAKKILILFLHFLFPTSLKEIFNIASL